MNCRKRAYFLTVNIHRFCGFQYRPYKKQAQKQGSGLTLRDQLCSEWYYPAETGNTNGASMQFCISVFTAELREANVKSTVAFSDHLCAEPTELRAFFEEKTLLDLRMDKYHRNCSEAIIWPKIARRHWDSRKKSPALKNPGRQKE